MSARCSPNGELLAYSHGSALSLARIDARALSFAPVSEAQLHTRAINYIAWSPCGRHIVTGGDDGLVIVWRLENDKFNPRRVLRGHTAPVICVSFDPKGVMVASGSRDQRVVLWSVQQGVLFKRFNAHGQPVTAVDFSYDSVLVLSASYDGLLRIWNLYDGFCVRSINVTGVLMPVLGARFTPNSEYVCVRYADSQTRLFYIEDKVVERVFGAADTPGPRLPCEFAFAGDRMYVTTESGVDVYNLQTQVLERHLLDEPAVTVDVRDNFGVAAGPSGVKLFSLS